LVDKNIKPGGDEMDIEPAASEEIKRRIAEIRSADIMVAIPSFNNESTISRVMQVVADGLSSFFGDRKCVLFVCEGGSLDETKNVARATDIGLTVEKIVGTYRGSSGKGNALRAVFYAAIELGVEGCALIDADTRSITPDWVNNLLDPVIYEGYDFVAPFYRRYKYDGTITNLLVYPLVSSLYGKKLRQPIGGDFALSRKMLEMFRKQKVWDGYVEQFGIDVWMTISAITEGAKICQANLGAKIHDAKDPAFSLGPMYMQVLSTLMRSMSRFEDKWKSVVAVEEVKVKGTAVPTDPEPIPISVTRLIEEYVMGMKHFSPLYREILKEENIRSLEMIAGSRVCTPEGYCDFHIPSDLWARIVYDICVIFNCWKGNTHKLIDLSSPLYFGMVASIANLTRDLSDEDAEDVIEGNLKSFVKEKDYLIKRWEELKAGKVCVD